MKQEQFNYNQIPEAPLSTGIGLPAIHAMPSYAQRREAIGRGILTTRSHVGKGTRQGILVKSEINNFLNRAHRDPLYVIAGSGKSRGRKAQSPLMAKPSAALQN